MLAAACRAPQPETPATAPPVATVAPSPTIAVAAPWKLEKNEDGVVVLRLGDSAQGARVDLRRTADGGMPGVAPIHGGRTYIVADGVDRWPMIAVGHPDVPLSAARIEVDGLDLVVRLDGPPLRALTGDPQAPDEPAHTIVRLRPRARDWRIVIDGLTTVSAAGAARARPADDGAVSVEHAWGRYELTTTAVKLGSAMGPARWWASTVPSLRLYAPMRRVAFTWAPPAAER